MKVRILGSLMFLIAISSCREQPAEEKSKEAVNVKSALVVKEEVYIPVSAPGTLSSKMQSNLSFLTGGIIREINVDEGEMAEKGEVLARLDMTEISSRFQQAQLGLEKAKRDFNRIQNLYRDTVASLEQYQDAQTALELARTNYRIARFNKRYSEIRAPSEGKILKRLAEVNEVTAPGRPVFVFASTEADWVMHLNLSDRDFVRVSVNDSAVVSFDAYPGKFFAARVTELASAADLMTGTYQTELLLLNAPERLVTGLIGRADIFPDKEELLIIPPEALHEAEGQNAGVYVVKNGLARRRNIRTGTILDRGIVVKEGLSAGDSIITEGNAYVKEGEKVKIND